MKKFTTKLLMSIIAVAFAFVALGTSTYAWFSMNNTVSVDGLNIAAKADETFLLISKDATTATAIQTENKTEAKFGMTAETAAKLLPVYYNGADSADATVSNKASWQIAYSTNPDESQGTTATKKAIPADKELSEYVLMETVHVTVAKDALKAKSLKVSSVSITNSNSMAGASVIITAVDEAGTGAGTGVLTADSDLSENPIEIYAGQFGDTDVVTVNIYFYFDGTNWLSG
jgi:hypothetical protein